MGYMFLFTGRWVYNWEGLYVARRGGRHASKRQLTGMYVCIKMLQICSEMNCNETQHLYDSRGLQHHQ